MLRWVIVLLVAANAGYFLWTQGHLAAWGLAPTEQAEPERLGTQIAPEALRLLNTPRTPETGPAPEGAPANEPGWDSTPAPASGLPLQTEPAPASGETPVSALSILTTAPVPSPTACWVINGFTEAQMGPLRSGLAQLGLAAGTWQISEVRSGGRWIVYMGRYDSAEALERKKAELRELQIPHRTVSTPGLMPGLALGTYSTEAAARQALQDAMRAGVRTARVAQERAESRSYALRLPAATPPQRAVVTELGQAVAGKALEPCR
jgi:hypothetical protein